MRRCEWKNVCSHLLDIVFIIALAVSSLVIAVYTVLLIGRCHFGDTENCMVAGTNMAGENTNVAIQYNRNTYVYRKGLVNVLVLGIDGDGDLYSNHTPGNMGQSDALFLISIDTIEHNIQLVSIPRDTMTVIAAYDGDGNMTSAFTAQIAVQYAYGQNLADSTSIAAESVSNLLNGVQIDRVIAMSMNSIADINDSVGGVDVTIDNDFTDESGEILEPAFIKGNTVHLIGDMARIFVQERDCGVNGSAMDRLSRQEQYFDVFIPKAEAVYKKNPFACISLIHNLEQKKLLYTDMTIPEAAYILSETLKCDFDNMAIYEIPGKIRYGEEYEEYHIDREMLKAMLINMFYVRYDR